MRIYVCMCIIMYVYSCVCTCVWAQSCMCLCVCVFNSFTKEYVYNTCDH